MKLKLGVHAGDSILYISYDLYSDRIRTVVAIAIYIFHILITGKVQICKFFFLSNGDIWKLFYTYVY